MAPLSITLTHLDLQLNEQYPDYKVLPALNAGRLQHLRLTARYMSRAACQWLAAFTSLTSLDLSYNNGTFQGDLLRLNALTRLTALSFRHSEVFAAGVAQLTTLTKLAVLNLDSLGGFNHFPGRIFPERRTSASRDIPAALACFPNLTDLDVSGSKCATVGSSLGSLTQLTQLAANECELLQQQPLSPLPSLRVLELRWSVEQESQLGHLTGLCGLTQLSLAHKKPMQLSQDGVRLLAGLTALRQLCLASCALSEGALEQLAQLPVLKALDLNWAELPPACDLSPLLRLRLERLRLPRELEAADQLPLGLRVAVAKGRRWGDVQWGAWRDRHSLLYAWLDAPL